LRKLKAIDPLSKLEISFGTGPSSCGDCHIGSCDHGICFLGFADEKTALQDLHKLFPHSQISVQKLDPDFVDSALHVNSTHDLAIAGTLFQIKVWQALMQIPSNTTISYEEFAAKHLGNKNYTRAAASAIARNNISYLIPCHLVVSKSGDIHKYRWGREIKKKMIEGLA